MKPTTPLASLALLALAAPALGATINVNPTNDTSIWHRDGSAGYNNANFGNSNELEIYHFDTNLNAYSYLQFDISTIPAGATIDAVTLTLTKITNVDGPLTGDERNDTLNTGRIAFYGLNTTAGNTAQNWSEATLTFDTTGDEMTSATIAAADPFNVTGGRSVNFDGLDTVTNSGTNAVLSGAAVNAFTQSRLDNGGLITFMIQNPDGTAGRGMAFGSSESASPAVLSIEYTPVPEPTVALLGGLGLLGMLRRRRA